MSDRVDPAHYSMVLEWDPKDRIYVVTVPELPGCQTHGETLTDAVRQGQEAIEGWIDAMQAWGRPIPAAHHFATRPVEVPAGAPVGVG